MSDEDETRELNALYWTAMRSLFGNFVEEHPEVTALLRANTEQIKEQFSRVIRRLSDDGEAANVGLDSVVVSGQDAARHAAQPGYMAGIGGVS